MPPRTVTSISLAKTRSSSGLVRWLTWRNCALTSCAWLVSIFRKQSAAGWLAKSISGWENQPSPFRDIYEVTRHAGMWILNNSRITWLEAIENIHFFSASYVKFLRRTRAAIVIQRNVRMWATRRYYQQQRSAAITIQCCLRAYMARKKYYKVRFPLLQWLSNSPTFLLVF